MHADEIGGRLIQTRKALNLIPSVFYRNIEDGERRGHNYETGLRRIATDDAMTLCSRWRLTLDWIYQGNVSSLPPDLRDKLQNMATQVQ